MTKQKSMGQVLFESYWYAIEWRSAKKSEREHLEVCANILIAEHERRKRAKRKGEHNEVK